MNDKEYQELMHSSDDDMNDKDGRAEEDADADELQVDEETPHPLTDKVSSKNDGPITHLSSIWDCKHIEKLGVKGGTEGQDKERWRCRHCCTEFTKWNTSKAMYHSAKISGHFIRPCPTKIPSNLLDSYRALVRRGQKNKTAIALSKKEHQEKISSRLQKNSRILQDRGGRMPKKSKSSMPEPNTPHTPHVAIAGQDVTVDEDDDQYVECCGTNRSCQPNHSVSFEKCPSSSPNAISSLSSSSSGGVHNSMLSATSTYSSHPSTPFMHPHGSFLHHPPHHYLQTPYASLGQSVPSYSTQHYSQAPLARNHRNQAQMERNSYCQQSIHSALARQATSENSESMRKLVKDLDTAIADMVICDGLNFNLGEKVRFMNVLKAAKKVNLQHYTPPNGARIGGELLDISHQTIMDTNRENLLLEANTYGIMFLGDGATIRKIPLTNMLAMGVHCPPAVLEIRDCSEHLCKGKKKCAKFIAECFIPHIRSLDPTGYFTDVAFYDGASNVQKGGRILETQFPRLKSLKGVEHCMALFFSDLAQVPIVKDTILRQSRLYLVFSSGIFHSAHSNFKAQTISFNGRPLGLLRATDVRMAGHFYAMMRTLRCRASLRATVSHFTWVKRKKTKKEIRAAIDVMDDELFIRFYVLVRFLLHACHILRLADGNGPGMDMLKYHCIEFLEAIGKYQRLLDNDEIFPMDDFRIDDQLQEDQHHNGKELGEEDDEDDEEDVADGDDGEDENVSEEDESGKGCEMDAEESSDVHDDADDDEDSDEGVESDEESMPESPIRPPPASELRFFSGKIYHLWAIRECDIVSDFATTAWICCVVPKVRAQVSDFFCLQSPQSKEKRAEIKLLRLKVDRCVRKLLQHLGSSSVIESSIQTFWNEWKAFQLKLAPFRNRDIWNVPTAVQGKSHLWHSNYSLYETQVLGFVACRTTSKSLGIGPAERSWGDVKYLGQGKRSNLASSRLEKQAVCYTHSCLERARIFRQNKEEQTEEQKKDVEFGWEERDLEFKLEVDGWNLEADEPLDLPKVVLGPKRIFKGWVEDWEYDELMKKDCPVAEGKFSKKYFGMHFLDIDHGIVHVIKGLHYERHNGWYVLSYKKGIDPPSTPDHELQQWRITDKRSKKKKDFPIVDLIRDTQQPPHLNVLVFKTEEDYEFYEREELIKDRRLNSKIKDAIEAESAHLDTGTGTESGDDGLVAQGVCGGVALGNDDAL